MTRQDGLLTSDSLAGLHVLVVDDDPDTCEIVALMLSTAGASVATACDGAAAEAAFAGRLPDVLIVDVHMPGEDGISLLRRIHARPELADVPAIAISAAQLTHEVVRRAHAAGCGYALSKPIEPAELVELVHEIAARPARLPSRQ